MLPRILGHLTLESLERERKAVTSETVGKRLQVEDLTHAGQERCLSQREEAGGQQAQEGHVYKE